MRSLLKKLLPPTSGTFFKKLLVSYFLMLSLLACIQFVLANVLTQTVEQSTNEQIQDNLLLYQSSLEENLDALDSLAQELTVDQKVMDYLNYDSSFSGQQHYDIVELIDMLDSYTFFNDYIQELFLFFSKQDYLITSRSVYSSKNWNQYWLNEESFISTLYEYREGSYTVLGGNGQHANNTAVQYSLPYKSSGSYKGQLVFIIDPMFGSSFEYLSKLSPDTQVFTLDQSGNLLFTTASSDTLTEKYGLDFSTISPGLYTSGEYTLYTSSSSRYPFLHTIIVPTPEFNQTITTGRLIINVCFLALFSVGLLLSFTFAHYNYLPIQRLADKLSPSHCPAESPLQRIESSIEELIDYQQNSAEIKLRQRQLYTEHLLSKLLHGEILSDVLVQDYIAKYNLEISGSYVQAVRLLDRGEAFREITPARIQGFIPEGSEKNWFVLPGKQDIVVAYIGPSPRPQLNWLNACINEKASRMIIAVSNVHTSPTQLALAYEETQKITDYMNFLSNRGVMHYSELSLVSTSNDRVLIFEMWFRKFCNFLTIQDLESAQEIQRQIFDELKNNNYSLQFVKCKIFSFVDHTINVIGEMESTYSEDLWEDYSLADRLMSCVTIEQLETEYYTIFQLLSNCLISTSSQDSVIDRICTIVNENYLDPMFCASFVSEQLNVSNAYISKVFKKATGRNMLEYVQMLRIEHAKELMKQPELTLNTIAQQSGFYNDVAFLRVFKKMEGITPGKYRSRMYHLDN